MNITISDALSRKRAINNKVLIYTFFKNCNRVNENGVLVFTKAGTTDLKPVIITIANANPEFPDLELSNYIRLNALGQIPEEMKIEFIISDELGAEELYDIYIYTSDLKIEEFDENFVFRPKAKEYQQFLIQVLNDRPFLDDSEINPVANVGIQNLVKYGQFQAVTLAENPKTVISSSESIAENIFYFVDVANTSEVEDVVADQLTIENTELIWNLESKPVRYLSINAINKPNATPNARYLALRFQNGNLFDAEDALNLKPFVVSFQARADQIIELDLFLQRVFFSTIEGTIVSLQQSEPIIVSTEWQKFSIVCNIDSTTQPIINDVNECFILFSLPANNIFDNFVVDLTNFLVYFGDTEIIYPPTPTNTNQFQEKIPQAYSPVINSPQGYIPLPLTVGRVTEYLHETLPQDKPTEIYADGRALKVTDYYKYALNYTTNIEIPYKWLFDKYGDRYGSGKDFINAMSPQASLNFDAASWVGITDFIIHTNDVASIDNASEFIDVTGNNNLFAKVNVFSYGYDNPTDYKIETYFIRENSSYLSLGIMVDSGFIADKLDNANFDLYLYGQKKTAIGNTTLNNQIKELTTAKDALYSTVQPHNQNFVVWGNTSLPTTLYIAPGSPNSQRYAKCIVANSLMSNDNFKFINADTGAFSDTTRNYSLRICIEQADIVQTHEQFQIFQAGVGTPLSHATITCYNPDVTDNTIVLTQNMNIFPMKYQIAGEVAVGILLKTNPVLTEFENSYFNIIVKTKRYTFWYSIFGFTEVPTIVKTANPTSEDFIVIDMSGAINLADPMEITERIMRAVNSYIFSIPDLRGMNSFSAGEGKQSSFINGYNIDNLGNIPNPAPTLVDEIKILKPILSKNLNNFVDFMPELNLKMALNASDGVALYLRPVDTSSAPGNAVRRYYPIDAEHHSINNQPVSLVNKYISLC